MTFEPHSFDRTVMEIMRELPRRFVEGILGSNVEKILDMSFPKETRQDPIN